MYKKILTLVKESFNYGIINSVAKSINIFLLPIFTRVFSPSEYGIIDIISISISLISVLVVLNLSSAMARYIYDSKESKEKYSLVSTLFYFISLSSIIFISLFWTQSEYVSYLLTKSKDHNEIIKIALLIIPFSILFDYLSLLLRMERNIKIYGVVNIGDILLTLLLSIYLVVFLRQGISGVFLARLISKIIMFGISFFFTYNYFTLNISKQLLKKCLIYSIPAAPAVFASWANSSLNRYFILAYLGINELGIFSVGFKIGMIMSLIVQSFRMGWVPFSMSIIGERDRKEIYGKVLTYYFISISVIGALIAIFAKEAVNILAGNQYREAYKIVGLIVGGIIMQGAFHIVYVGSMIAEKSYVVTVSSVVGMIANILLMQLLIPTFGIIGAAIAFFASFLISFLICYLFSQKYFYIHFDEKKIFWILSLYMGVIVFSILSGSIEPLSLRYFLKLLVLFCFFFGLYTTSIDRKEISLAKTLIVNKFNGMRGTL